MNAGLVLLAFIGLAGVLAFLVLYWFEMRRIYKFKKNELLRCMLMSELKENITKTADLLHEDLLKNYPNVERYLTRNIKFFDSCVRLNTREFMRVKLVPLKKASGMEDFSHCDFLREMSALRQKTFDVVRQYAYILNKCYSTQHPVAYWFRQKKNRLSRKMLKIARKARMALKGATYEPISTPQRPKQVEKQAERKAVTYNVLEYVNRDGASMIKAAA